MIIEIKPENYSDIISQIFKISSKYIDYFDSISCPQRIVEYYLSPISSFIFPPINRSINSIKLGTLAGITVYQDESIDYIRFNYKDHAIRKEKLNFILNNKEKILSLPEGLKIII